MYSKKVDFERAHIYRRKGQEDTERNEFSEYGSGQDWKVVQTVQWDQDKQEALRPITGHPCWSWNSLHGEQGLTLGGDELRVGGEDVKTRKMDCFLAVWGKGKMREIQTRRKNQWKWREEGEGIFETSSEKWEQETQGGMNLSKKKQLLLRQKRTYWPRVKKGKCFDREER